MCARWPPSSSSPSFSLDFESFALPSPSPRNPCLSLMAAGERLLFHSLPKKSRAKRHGRERLWVIKKARERDIEEEEKLTLGNLRPRLNKKNTGGPRPDHLAHQAEQTAVPGPRGHLGCSQQRPGDRLWRGWRERALEEEEEMETEMERTFPSCFLFFFFMSPPLPCPPPPHSFLHPPSSSLVALAERREKKKNQKNKT